MRTRFLLGAACALCFASPACRLSDIQTSFANRDSASDSSTRSTESSWSPLARSKQDEPMKDSPEKQEFGFCIGGLRSEHPRRNGIIVREPLSLGSSRVK